MAKASWTEIDKDDVPGYLMDDIMSFIDKHEIKTEDDIHEAFQNDQFLDELQDFATDVIKAGLEYKQ